MLCGLVGASLTLRFPRSQDQDSPKPQLDLVQPFLLFTTIAMPLFALNLGGTVTPWHHPVVITLFACTPLALGGLLLASTRPSATPLIPRAALNQPSVLALFAATFVIVYAFNAVSHPLCVTIRKVSHLQH